MFHNMCIYIYIYTQSRPGPSGKARGACKISRLVCTISCIAGIANIIVI